MVASMRTLVSTVVASLLLVACSKPASNNKPSSTGGTGAVGAAAAPGGGAAASGAAASAAPPVKSSGSGGSATPPSTGSGGRGATAGDAGVASRGNGGANAPGSGDASTDAATSAAPTPGLFPPVTDFVGNGPFTATTIDSTGPSNNYTVYMPKEPAPAGAKNPIVAWMSGGGTTPSGYPLLPHLASHGFVVVASNTAPGIGDEVNLGKELIAGIDWAIAENARMGSPLFDRLDTTKIASMGYSMGSLATFTIANDPRLTTTVHISGGNMAPERVNNLHAPAAFLCGIPGDDTCNILSTDCDIAAANCDTDFMNAKTPVFYANFPGGHLGILTPPNQDPIHAAATAWLRWQLMGDTTLKAQFVGDQCTVCKDPNWKKVQQKSLM
jgi:dienelactone hydrolase